jgi:arginase
MSAIDLIVCPYDMGRRNWRCGLGPAAILQNDAVARLEAAGANVRVVEIETRVDYECESDLVFEAQRQIAERTARAREEERWPVILAGNCNAAVGGASGIGGGKRGLIWFDAHGDYCTPETSDTGFIDGMGLSMMVGRCWPRALSTIRGYAAIAQSDTILVGARDLDPWEVEDLAVSQISELSVETIRSGGVRAAFEPALRDLAGTVDRIYLHIDIDVHDPLKVPANHYNAPDGLWADEVREAVELIARHVRIAAVSLGSYDPAADPDGKTAEVAVELLEVLYSKGLNPDAR